jgi:hypothetical protein
MQLRMDEACVILVENTCFLGFSTSSRSNDIFIIQHPLTHTIAVIHKSIPTPVAEAKVA